MIVAVRVTYFTPVRCVPMNLGCLSTNEFKM